MKTLNDSKCVKQNNLLTIYVAKNCFLYIVLLWVVPLLDTVPNNTFG